MKRSKVNAEHYKWGQDCDGWRLVDRPQRSIIHERMPPGTAEAKHYHVQSAQFFFVLSGEAVMEVEGSCVTLQAHEGIEILPGMRHQICNKSAEPVEFLVISEPNTKGDRYEGAEA